MGLSCAVYPASTGTDCLCSRLSFQEYLYHKQPWKKECLPLEQRTGTLTVHYKRFEFPNLRISLHCVGRCHPMEIGAQRTSERKCWFSGHCHCCES